MSYIVYRFKVTFEDVDEVERVIEIRAGQTFLDLHNIIQEAIGFDNSKPASFYMSGDNWRMGREIAREEDRGVALMKDSKMNQFVNDPHQRILYVTDYDAEWTLRVELIQIRRSDEDAIMPVIIRSVGEAPKQYKPVHVNDISEFDTLVKGIMSDDEDEDDDDEDDEDDDDLDDDEEDEDDTFGEDDGEIDEDDLSEGFEISGEEQ